MAVKRTQEERSEATRAALVGAARELFAERGYAAVSTEEIVQRAGVTRGALYHHFEGKAEVFGAVVEAVEAELTERIAQEVMATATNPLEAMRAGAHAFLDTALDPAIQRITLIDAPSVLGWERWREIGSRHGLGLITASLEAAMEGGLIERRPVRPLAHMLMGMLDEAALLVARAADVQTMRREVGESIDGLLDSLATG